MRVRFQKGVTRALFDVERRRLSTERGVERVKGAENKTDPTNTRSKKPRSSTTKARSRPMKMNPRGDR